MGFLHFATFMLFFFKLNRKWNRFFLVTKFYCQTPVIGQEDETARFLTYGVYQPRRTAPWTFMALGRVSRRAHILGVQSTYVGCEGVWAVDLPLGGQLTNGPKLKGGGPKLPLEKNFFVNNANCVIKISWEGIWVKWWKPNSYNQLPKSGYVQKLIFVACKQCQVYGPCFPRGWVVWNN